MKANSSDWYKKGWTLDIKKQSWTENTKEQVDFIIKSLDLKGDEKILDLACGYGRHSLEFARRGYYVTGIDITEAYIEDADKNGLTLSVFEWDSKSRIMLYGQNDFAYGEILCKPNIPSGNPTRLYTQKEIAEIMEKRGMKLVSSYCDYMGTPASEKGFQLIACSRKLYK